MVHSPIYVACAHFGSPVNMCMARGSVLQAVVLCAVCCVLCAVCCVLRAVCCCVCPGQLAN
jgi:hypothetical protein